MLSANTPQTSKQPDCLIIGGGLVGMLTARSLAAAGMRVRVYEKARAASQASWAGGGILSPLHPWRYPEAVSALAATSQALFPEIIDELREQTGIDAQYRRSGLRVFAGQSANRATEGSETKEDPETKEDSETNSAAVWNWCQRWQPDAEKQGNQLFLPSVAQLRTPRFGQAVRASLQAAGVELVEQQAVTELLLDRGRCIGVRTAAGAVHADSVVLAAGAWSGQIKGLPTAIPVRPIKGQMLALQGPVGVLDEIWLRNGTYLIPRSDGLILLGSTLEDTGFDASTDRDARQALLAELENWRFQASTPCSDADTVERILMLPVVKQWAGLRPAISRQSPIIAEHQSVSGLFINSGHFRNGVVLSPASAQLLADLILKRQPFNEMEIDPTQYQLAC